MDSNTVVFYNQVRKVWEEIAREGSHVGTNFQLEVHKKLLNIFQPGAYYYFIFNVGSAEFEFVSDQIQDILGYDPENLKAASFLDNIHPDDQLYFIQFEQKLAIFFRELSIEKILKYKVQYDFRIKDINGKYKRILHQLTIIEHDEYKNLLRSFGIHTDISHIKKDGKPELSFIGFDGEPSFHNIPVESTLFLPAKELFTKREKEVLKLVVNGFLSSEIAERLFISLHTVNTHRKNILRKSNCSTLPELISKTIKEGWV